jgi:hypothetical protein
MTDERWVKSMAEAARDEREVEIPPELARPFDAAEMAALSAKVASALPVSNVVPLRPRRRWPFVAAAFAPVAAAAIAVLVLRTPSSGVVLPPYDLSVEASDEGATRGLEPAPSDAVIRRAPTGRLQIVVRPHDPTIARAEARVMLEAAGQLRDWPVAIERSSEGAFRILAEASALERVPAGGARVIVFVADASRMPKDDAACRRAMDGNAPGVQVKILRIEIAR